MDALTELLALVQGLNAVADTFEQWATDRADPKIAARQLALWQDDIHTRFWAATAGNSATFAGLPDATKTGFREEQSAIQKGAQALNLPASDVVKISRDHALMHLSAASNFLVATGANADEAMKQSAAALFALSEKVPTVSERRDKTRADLASFQLAQDSIFVEIEQIIRGTASSNKLASLTERQRKQIAAFEALDLPGLDVRRARIIAALRAATADLKDNLLSDAVASQQWVKREIERLKLVLNGFPAPDDAIDAIARRMYAVVRAIEELGPKPNARQLAPHTVEVQDCLTQLGQFPIAPEAQSLHFNAQTALLAAESAVRDKSLETGDLQLLKSAANALSRYSSRLIGAESNIDRVRRLAESRRETLESEALRKREKKDPDPTAASRVSGQLAREAQELALTRVGFAGQSVKKRVLDQYGRLKEQPYPDRLVGLHKMLAESLDELAALMADNPAHHEVFDRSMSPALPTAVDSYLPSRPLTASIRELAQQQHSLHDRITGLPATVRQLLKATAENPLAELTKEQRVFAIDLTDFAQKLEVYLDADSSRLMLAAAADATRRGRWID